MNNNKLLLEEIKIKEKLIKTLNEIIDQQQTQINYYRHMIKCIQDLIDDKIIDV